MSILIRNARFSGPRSSAVDCGGLRCTAVKTSAVDPLKRVPAFVHSITGFYRATAVIHRGGEGSIFGSAVHRSQTGECGAPQSNQLNGRSGVSS